MLGGYILGSTKQFVFTPLFSALAEFEHLRFCARFIESVDFLSTIFRLGNRNEGFIALGLRKQLRFLTNLAFFFEISTVTVVFIPDFR